MIPKNLRHHYQSPHIVFGKLGKCNVTLYFGRVLGDERSVAPGGGVLHDAERQRGASAGRRQAQRRAATAAAGCTHAYCRDLLLRRR